MKKQLSLRMSDKVFNAIVYVLTIFCALMCLYPIYLVVISSFSDPYAVASGKVFILPKGFSLDAYKEAFQNGDIMRGYMNSIVYLFAGTLFNMVLTIPAAYALSKSKLLGRNFFMMMIVFTMYFSGGLIPAYLLIQNLGLLNTRWVVIFSGGISATNLIVARTFFASGVPRELEEAAEIDGASIPMTFFRIVLPLSKAMLGVIVLYYAVGRWNNFTSSLYFQPMSEEYHSLQMELRKILVMMQTSAQTESESAEYFAQVFNQIKYSVIVLASAPLMAIYPFLQKYFDKGVMLGSVKG